MNNDEGGKKMMKAAVRGLVNAVADCHVVGYG
jgi:hypothetical protein